MKIWKEVGQLGLAVVVLSMSACSASYDCSSGDVIDALVEEAATSGFVPYMKDVPADWEARLTDHTNAKNVVTLEANNEIEHFRCRANLEYREDTRTVTSKDITYEVRKIEGKDDFSLEWEIENNGIADIDPIKLFAMDVQGPWKGELEKQLEAEVRGEVAAKKEEALAWARGHAADYAAKNPPISFDRDALKKKADDYLSSRDVETIMEQFDDIDGDGFLDYFTIVASHEFNDGEFAEETENYGEYTNTGGFMRKSYFLLAVTQRFAGFGIATNIGLQDPIKVTTADGEKVTEKYLRKDIANFALPPPNPISAVSKKDGVIVVSLADGQSVAISEFKPEKTLEQMRQERLVDLEKRLAYARENDYDTSRLYQ